MLLWKERKYSRVPTTDVSPHASATVLQELVSISRGRILQLSLWRIPGASFLSERQTAPQVPQALGLPHAAVSVWTLLRTQQEVSLPLLTPAVGRHCAVQVPLFGLCPDGQSEGHDGRGQATLMCVRHVSA